MAGERYGDVDIPLDLTVEILKKLPAKSIMRFQCVSKQWRNTIRDFIIIDSIVTRSLTKPSREDPHFIFQKKWSPLAYQNEEKLYHEKVLYTSYFPDFKHCQYVRGLIGFWSLRYGRFAIDNPTTSQCIILPDVSTYLEPGKVRSFLFGYDPLENQYKVVCFIVSRHPRAFQQVFTLGDPKKQWRNIQCSIRTHSPLIQPAVCINGAIYYKAMIDESGVCFLASFDVMSEKFNHLQAPEDLTAHFRGDSTLVNYQGKLGCIRLSQRKDVYLWVMEDAKKQEWSKITLLSMLKEIPSYIKISGVTNPGGEILIVPRKYKDVPIKLEVHYCDPKRNSRRSVEIKATMPTDLVQMWAVTDHVENTMWF